MKTLSMDTDPVLLKMMHDTLALRIQGTEIVKGYPDVPPELVELPNGSKLLRRGRFAQGDGGDLRYAYVDTPRGSTQFAVRYHEDMDGWYPDYAAMIVGDDAWTIHKAEHYFPVAVLAAHVLGLDDLPDMRYIRYNNQYDRLKKIIEMVGGKALYESNTQLSIREQQGDTFAIVTCDRGIIKLIDEKVSELAIHFTWYWQP